MTDTFNKDVIFGEEAEKHVLKLINKKYPSAYKMEGNFKYYDLFIHCV